MEKYEPHVSGAGVPTHATRPILDWSDDQIQLLKDTVARGTTDDEFKLFLYVCTRTGLDPFLRQIHMVKRWDSNLKREIATIQTGIDGYRVIAERSGSYAGVDAPKFTYEPGNPYPSSATVTVYRMIGGLRVGFTATAFFDEYKQTTREGRLTRFWEKMPKSQLSKCAEALALRKAFPNDLSGLYTNEEMEQASEVVIRPATEKQLSYIESLLRNESVPDEVRSEIEQWFSEEEKTIDVASSWINTLQQYSTRETGSQSDTVSRGIQGDMRREAGFERGGDTSHQAADARHSGSYDTFDESDAGYTPDVAVDRRRAEPGDRGAVDVSDQRPEVAEPPSRPRKRGGKGIATAAAKESREVREKPNREAVIALIQVLEQQIREETEEGPSMNFDKLRQMFAGNADLGKASPAGLSNYHQHLRDRVNQGR